MSEYKKKLIEVALPLEAINRESAREKSIRHGHPSTLHLWWARRPLAACRAVLFSQLVDDPSAHPDQFPTEEAQATERQRLFRIIERLVVWENINDQALLREANEEILKSTDGNPPAILDPFAGGGSIPLEAQRLGLEAQASDLNPVAVLLNKALIEIPPKWAGHVPVFPSSADGRLSWPGATGLAEDVRRYAGFIRDEAEARIGHLYPKARLDDGTTANVVAWLWARTVVCPNPACAIDMPLVRSWILSKKKGQEVYLAPELSRSVAGSGTIAFSIVHGVVGMPSAESGGTVNRNGARCFACGTSAPLSYVREEGQEGRMGRVMTAIVAESGRRRYYIAPSPDQVFAAEVEVEVEVPDFDLAHDKMNIKTPLYGMTKISDLFTSRQLVAMATFSDLVIEVRPRVRADAIAAGLNDDLVSLEAGGTGATAYADAVALYLGLGVGRATDINNAFCSWENTKTQVRHLFTKQAIPMIWDYAEAPPLSQAAAGSYVTSVANLTKALERTPARNPGTAIQADAAKRDYTNVLVATDPPYYDNIGYANLSDFFYAWLRRSLSEVLPNLFGTLQTPKVDELVADQYRHGSKQAASNFFESGFNDVFALIRQNAQSDYPITVFYAFKQSESDTDGTVSTGWQTLLEGMLKNGWEVTATWPMRTELANKVSGIGSNMLASSIVLALRPRAYSAETTSRRAFVQTLRQRLPRALLELQQGSIAPVDMAQAAIGPGMSVFSHYARVLEADGSDMSVRTALALINQALDEVLAEQEGDFDPETRFAVKWFTQYGWNEVASGEADVLTRAVNTTVAMLERGGIFRAVAGKARLLEPSEMSEGWNPAEDKEISVWEVAVRLGHALLTSGTDQASMWMRESASRVDLDAVKELAYLMFSICERSGWTESAMLFNALGTSWSDVSSAARSTPVVSRQGALDFGEDDD